MPQQAWSAKRERQYEHIKAGLKKRGRSEGAAEEIAARTVNKERARPARPRSRPPVADGYLVGPSRRAAIARGPGGRTRDQLYEEAKRKNITGPVEDDEGAAAGGGEPEERPPLGVSGSKR